MAKKVDLTNKKVGKLLVKSIVPKELRPSQNHGNYWYCDCDCGNKNVMVPTTYLTGNSNYTQYSCGCDRAKRAFLASSRPDMRYEFIDSFSNFEKFLLIHKLLMQGTRDYYATQNLQNYEQAITYFYNDTQFNAIYNFWNKQSNTDKTFYDWAKPSLDHIIPKSKGGTNDLNNLQFLTVFENLGKRDMTMQEWNDFKKETNTYSDYYIESIMKGGQETIC